MPAGAQVLAGLVGRHGAADQPTAPGDRRSLSWQRVAADVGGERLVIG